MRLQVKPRYQPVRECSIEEVNSLLDAGELVGEDKARTPGSELWTRLAEIPGVSVPQQDLSRAPEPTGFQPSYSLTPYRKVGTHNSLERPHGRLSESQNKYKHPKVLSRFLFGLLGMYGILTALLLGLDTYIMLQSDIARGPDGMEQVEVARLLVLLCTFLVIIFTYPIFGWWIVRANKNVRALGAVGLRESPGWALGWFFVPLFCIWRPWIAMKQLWHASHDPVGWAMQGKAVIVAIWWTLWLASNGLGRWNARLQFSLKPEDVLKEKFVNLAAGISGLASITTAVFLVYSINRAQMRAKVSMLPPVVA